MPAIHLKRLQQIIREELHRHTLHEGEQAKTAIDHAQAATKCLDAIEKYKEAASSKALAEMQSELDKVEQILNRVVASPLNYADAVPESPGPDTEGDLTSSKPSEASDSAVSGPKKKSVKPNVVG